MAKIVVAFSRKDLNEQFSRALEAEGFEVFRTCVTGNEVIRAFNMCQDGILLCGFRFADRTADMLAADLGDRVLTLVVGKPEQLELCESYEIFKLVWPATRSELAGALRMLVQLHYKRLPHRSSEEKDLIEKAKKKLMEEKGCTEKEAHQTLQKISMRSGMKMSESAKQILDGRLEM